MNLPDAPIAEEGFYVTHFLAVDGRERSAKFYVDVLGGTVVKAKNPCYIKLSNSWPILNSAEAPRLTNPRSSSRRRETRTHSAASLTCAWPISRASSRIQPLAALISTGTASNFLLSRTAGIPYIPSTSSDAIDD